MYLIGAKRFTTKAAITEWFSVMLLRHDVGEQVDGADGVDLAALLEKHPNYQLKIADGVAGFTVLRGQFGTRCFGIVRPDGSSEDFSYMKCIGAMEHWRLK
jgi:hypothetical protein